MFKYGCCNVCRISGLPEAISRVMSLMFAKYKSPPKAALDKR